MNETARVRFKRLESFGNYCNAEAEVCIEFIAAGGQVNDKDLTAAFRQCTEAVDDQIEAAVKRHLTQQDEYLQIEQDHWRHKANPPPVAASEDQRRCRTCRHAPLPIENEPCASCNRSNPHSTECHWEPRQALRVEDENE